MVLNTNTERETGRAAQRGNVQAAKAVADIVRTTLGPRAMLKMLLDPMGGIVMTNDGNAILREVDVSHPAAKSMIELSRGQDEEVGDGTTSVIIMAGELMAVAEPFLEYNMHPTQIVGGYNQAMQATLKLCESMAVTIDTDNMEEMSRLVSSCLGTKFSSRWGPMMCNMALEATMLVATEENGRKEIDIKRYCKVEKIPGGELGDCRVLKGVMFNKDVTHSKMARRIENPRVILLDCPLEYKKGDSQMNIEMTKEEDWNQILQLEEEYIQNMCAQIVAFNPDIVITEKGLSDLAQHYFLKAGITAFRRLRKTDNNRVARASGATVVSRPEELCEADVGTKCGLFDIKKIGDEYFAHFEECRDPKACTILLRGGSKDVLNEIERNLQDAMQVARNVVYEPKLLPGGGATEMALSVALQEQAALIEGVQQWPFKAVGEAFEVIPRTLAENCGADVVRVITELRAKHAGGSNLTWGIDGCKGTIADMNDIQIWEPYNVKVQSIKTAMESTMMLLRIDDIVSGLKKKK
jgi:T-complex protein 1 subunit gamma